MPQKTHPEKSGVVPQTRVQGIGCGMFIETSLSREKTHEGNESMLWKRQCLNVNRSERIMCRPERRQFFTLMLVGMMLLTSAAFADTVTTPVMQYGYGKLE